MTNWIDAADLTEQQLSRSLALDAAVNMLLAQAGDEFRENREEPMLLFVTRTPQQEALARAVDCACEAVVAAAEAFLDAEEVATA